MKINFLKPAICGFAVLVIGSFVGNVSAQQNRVISVRNLTSEKPAEIRLGDYVRVEVEDLISLLSQPPRPGIKTILFIDNLPMRGIYHLFSDSLNKTLVYRVTRDSSSVAAWNIIYKYPRPFQKQVSISVGYEDTSPLPSEAKLTFILVSKLAFWLALSGMGIVLVLLIFLAKKSGIIRDESASENKPFSLSRTQLAYWTIIVISMFVYIWVLTSEIPPITGSTLILLAISIGTSAGAKVVDSSQSEIDRHQDLNSDGFLIDLLSDSNGVSIHRLQMLVWTIVLGLYFVRTSILYLTIPQLDDSMLALMGISNGAYVGLKIPENSGQVTPVAKEALPEPTIETPAVG